MDKIKQVENNLKMVLRHWGFGEICSSIYATLAVSDRPLTAKEISERINYAYTTTINALNHSIGLRHIKKIRENGRNVYTIETDLSDIIRERLNYFLLLLEETENSIRKLDGNLKAKLRRVFRMIDNAKNFIKKIEKTKAII